MGSKDVKTIDTHNYVDKAVFPGMEGIYPVTIVRDARVE